MTAPDADVERVLDRLREYRSQGSVEIPDAALLEIGHMIRAALTAMPRPWQPIETAPTKRPRISHADEWQLWLRENANADAAFVAVQIVEAIEEHQKALAREVYALREDTEDRYTDAAKRDDTMGAFARGRITEAKSIARAVNAIMPYSRDPAALPQPLPPPPAPEPRRR